MAVDKHQKLYGYNFKDDQQLQARWLERLQGKYIFPQKLVPEYTEGTLCKHGKQFSSSDENLYKESNNFVLYSELIEKMFDIPVYARRSVGPCKCLQRLDGTKFLVWNLGQGRFIDFTLLYSYMQKWANSGLQIFALWKSITNTALSCGISCSSEYNDLHRSICGIMNNLEMDFKSAFSCPTHGSSPAWVVSDGKNMGPLKRRVDHLKELDRESSDNNILAQSTTFKNRIFLNSKKERMLVCQLLTSELSMIDFAEVSDLTSANGLLIIELVRHILEKFPEGMPSCYKHFLANISKPTSVRGLLQVLTPEPLVYLEQYCKEELNLRDHRMQKQLQCIATNLPAIWPDLDSICNIENSEYLPKQVSEILLTILRMRYC